MRRMTAAARTRSDENKGDEIAAQDTTKAAGQEAPAGGRAAADSVVVVGKDDHHDAEAVADAAEADAEAGAAHDDEADDDADLLDEAPAASSSGVGAGAAAVVSTVLGFAALTGTWTSRVAAERQTLIGQLGAQQTDSPADQVAALYGNGWHMTALVNGGFALLALVVAAVVLVRPSFGTPGAGVRPAWVSSFAWAGFALGVLGLLVSAGMYFDLFAAMPTPPAAPTGAGAGQ
ncbi:hypothetical protein GCM10010353_12420 [Streptomyces chryseus]|nr:hypothetical protein GCM10010353_12420 [Streptomyces chryseus]